MAYVIAAPCVGVKDTACVTACPCDCIHPTPSEADAFANVRQLYIDPDVCIDCHMCAMECPVAAIFPEVEVPVDWREFIAKNAEYFNPPAKP